MLFESIRLHLVVMRSAVLFVSGLGTLTAEWQTSRKPFV